jgi:hypothetical protein
MMKNFIKNKNKNNLGKTKKTFLKQREEKPKRWSPYIKFLKIHF